MGARFAKWRAVIAVGDGIPSRGCIEANAHALARYAALCQEAGLVPSSSRKCSWTASIPWSGAGSTEEVLQSGLPPALYPTGDAGGHDPEAQHGASGIDLPQAGAVDEVADATVSVSCGPSPLLFRELRFCREANPPNWPRPV